MPNADELGLINQKLETLQKTVDEMKTGLWKRVEDHSTRLPVVEDRVNDLRRVVWYIISAILGLFVSAVGAAVVMRHG